MKNGVPFHIVFKITELLPHERFAMAIVFSEFEGNKFNWTTKQFEEPS